MDNTSSHVYPKLVLAYIEKEECVMIINLDYTFNDSQDELSLMFKLKILNKE